jgi:hypothetical protein
MKKEDIIVRDVTFFDGNFDQLSKINLVGKTISEVRISNYSVEETYYATEGYCIIYFEDGDTISFNVWDETIFVSFNFIPVAEESLQLLSADNPMSRMAKGELVVSSTFCGKKIKKGVSENNGMVMHHGPSFIELELENGNLISFVVLPDEECLGVSLN